MKPETVSRMTPIAIIGIECIFPKAEILKDFWSNVREGVDAITKVPDTHWTIDEYFDKDPQTPDMTYGYTGGFIPHIDFDPLEYAIAPNVMEAIDTSQLLGLIVANRLMEKSGYGLKGDFDRDKTSVVLGITGSLKSIIPLGARLGFPIWQKAMRDAGINEDLTEKAVENIAGSYVEWQEQSFPGLLGNVVSGRIANYMDLGGTNCTVDAACGSSLSALHLACLELSTGKSDLAITGGVDTFNDIFMFMCFSKTPALSPTGHAKPFDHKSDGTIIGEGIGMVLLKRLEDAEKDGDNIYAVIRGVGTSSDGKSGSIYAPKSEGQVKAMAEAYKVADVSPRTVELMEAHGTGTKVGDITELTSMQTLYSKASDDKEWCALGSVKSNMGHTKAAAGTAGLIKIALGLHHKVLPPTIKVEKPLGDLATGNSPFYVNADKRPWLSSKEHPRRAAVSAFGFGGSNYHCVVEEYEKEKKEIDWDGRVQILVLSSDDRGDLTGRLSGFGSSLSWKDLCVKAYESRKNFNKELNFRLAIVVEKDKTDMDKLISGAKTMLEKFPEKKTWNTPDGAYFSSGQCSGPLGIVFPGQGSQYVGMMRDLECQFPQAYSAMDLANYSFDKNKSQALNKRLADYIYPIHAFADDIKQMQEKELRDTRVAQPALGAVSLGAYGILDYFGVSAEAFAGHSYGELTALCAAGRLTPEELNMLSALRGNLMADREGDLGSMIAVKADVATIEKILDEHSLDLVIANKNAPDQSVLSGSTPEIERAEKLLASLGVKGKKLPVAAAFHSSLIADAQIPFAEALIDIPFPEAQSPVFSNTTSVEYPDEPDQARTVLAGQLAKPVQFVDEIINMYRYGIRTFLEVGPGAGMTGLVKSILKDMDDFEAFALDSSMGKRHGVNDLARTIAQLSVLGYDINLSLWNPMSPEELNAKKPKMSIPLCGANYINPKGKKSKPAAKRSAVAEKTAVSTVSNKGASIEKPLMQKPRTMASPVQQMQQPQQAAIPQPKYIQQTPAAIPQVPVSGNAFMEALRITQSNIEVLQNIQIQTAQLHERFLMNQDEAIKSFQMLAYQQQQLMGLAPAMPMQPVQYQASPVVPLVAAPVMQSTPAPMVEIPAVAVAASEKVQVPATESITPILLDIVSEKTGYPIEMLETGMSLDSDLGIDSIKRVEIFSALKERIPQADSIKAEDMGKLKTLEDITRFIAAVMPASGQSQETPSEETGASINAEDVSGVLLGLVSEKTGYPLEMLELDMSLDSDLGIDSIKRVEIFSALREQVPAANEIKADQMASLKTLRDISQFVADSCKAVTPVRVSSGEPSLSPEKIAETLLKLVSEKTGYPVEMLEMEMSLDSDLGIDSIKRVEIFSALKDELPAARDMKADQMTALKTLRDISEFISQASRESKAESPSGISVTALMSITPEQVSNLLLELVSDKTGYPAEMLEMDMSLDSDLGIDSIKRVEIFSALKDQLPIAREIKAEHINTLKTLRDIADFIASMPGNAAGAAVSETEEKAEPPGEDYQDELDLKLTPADLTRSVERIIPFIDELKEEDREGGVSIPEGSEIWIAGEESALTHNLAKILEQKNFKPRFISRSEMYNMPSAAGPGGLLIAAPSLDMDDDFLKDSFKLLRAATPGLKTSAGESGAFFFTISKMGGAFGLEGIGEGINPLQGGLAGLSKTAGHELTGVNCKAIDIDPSLETEEDSAARIVDEIFLKGPAEVGIAASGKFTIRMALEAPESVETPFPMEEGEVLLITGGARGVTAECAVKIASRLEGSAKITILLLGRSGEPQEEPEWLVHLDSESAIKKEIMVHAGKKLTPRDLQNEYHKLMSNREILRNMRRIDAKGANVVYSSVDVRDEAALRVVIDEAESEFGKVTGIIHGAGVIADKLIEDKTDEEFGRVYDTKVLGLRNLLKIFSTDDLKMIGLFSSTTGRIGRKGQIDYAVANEVLNKTAQQQSKLRPGCHVVSFNWGPWDGGMVTPALKKLFAEEGVGVIPVNAGAEFLFHELSLNEGHVEVMVMGKIETGDGGSGSDEVGAGAVPHIKGEADSPDPSFSVAFERTLDVEGYPVLKSHVLDNRAVVPMALVMEWLSQGAIHNNPGLKFAGCNDIRILRGIKLEKNSSLSFRVLTGKPEKTDGIFIVPVELRTAGADGSFNLNARADVILSSSKLTGEPVLQGITSQPFEGEERIYRDFLFHGDRLHGIIKIVGCCDEGISANVKTAPKPGEWIRNPLRNNWIMDPLAIDSSFQMMILWSIQKYGSRSLPTYAGSYRQFDSFRNKDITINIRVKKHNDNSAVADMEFVDSQGVLIARVENYECIIDPSLEKAFAKNDLHDKIMH